jgi:hypothetical protein
MQTKSVIQPMDASCFNPTFSPQHLGGTIFDQVIALGFSRTVVGQGLSCFDEIWDITLEDGAPKAFS